MISIILPYWQRPLALTRALSAFSEHYSGLDFEVVIVDDGNAATPPLDGVYDYPVRIVHLPRKDEPLNPCVPINAGVAAATGDYIVLTNPEIIHTAPILRQMRAELDRLGPKGYVLAAAWCPEEGAWHCHSSIAGDRPDGVRQPPGSGFHFCAMLRRDLFREAGGFDEEYRAGAGYDDPDWVNRLAKVGAVFKIRDDLSVIHPRMGARSAWPREGFRRNRGMFFAKWPLDIVVACVNAGNYLGRGAEYVANLRDGVARHLKVPYRFEVFEPHEASWWAKLALFDRDAFSPGQRVLYLDLDTVVTGDLLDIATMPGAFCCLRDFYRPWGLGSGVMLWTHGTCDDIADEWHALDRPRLSGGDQMWIETRRPDAIRIQDRLPGQVVSFKADCQTIVPPNARLVCFHGQPRPHETRLFGSAA